MGIKIKNVMDKQLRTFFTCAALAAGLLCLTGCKTQDLVLTVPEIHEVHHWHTDSTHNGDTLIREKETVVLPADSAMMAQFGVQLREHERAWMIRTRELERQLQRMERTVTDRDTLHDSIPYPVEVPVEVPAELTWWQQTRLHLANVVLWLLGILAVVWFVRRRVNL